MTENKCKCQKYYKCEKFDNMCSRCYSVENPEGWKEFLVSQWCPASFIPDVELANFIEENRIKSSAVKMLSTALKMDYRNLDTFCSILNALKMTHKNKLGITADEAGELYQQYRQLNNITNKPQLGSNSDWRWQHIFAGLIFDRWNIRTDKNGPLALCYYGNFGAQPRGTIDMLYDSCYSCWITNDEKKKSFWVSNLPSHLTDELI